MRALTIEKALGGASYLFSLKNSTAANEIFSGDDAILWLDAAQPTFSDTAAAVLATPFAGRVRRINYRPPLTGNAQAPTDPLRPYRENGALNFQVGAGHYLNAPALANCPQNAITIAINFTVRDKPEGSPQCLICNGALKLWLFSDNFLTVNFNSGGNNWYVNDPSYVRIPLGSACTWLLSISPTGMESTVLINGVRTDYAITNSPAATVLNAANWFIGYDGSSSGDMRYHGALTQAIVIPGTISAERKESLIAAMGAVPSPRYCPPEVPLVTICGDSIARANGLVLGVDLSNSWAMKAQQTLNGTQPTNLVNAAKIGDTIGNQRDVVFPTIVNPFYSASRARNVLMVQVATNDLATLNHDGPTTLADYYSLCDLAKAAGWRVVVCTVLPRSGTGHDGTFDTARSYFNTHLRSEWAGRGYSAMADFAGITGMGADGDDANTTYYNPDSIHPNTNGHAQMAPVASTAMQAAIT